MGKYRYTRGSLFTGITLITVIIALVLGIQQDQLLHNDKKAEQFRKQSLVASQVSKAQSLPQDLEGQASLTKKSQEKASRPEAHQLEASLEEIQPEEESLKTDPDTPWAPMDYASIDSVGDIIQQDLAQYGYDPANFMLAYYNFQTGEEYYWQADLATYAASTNKVGTAMLYTQLIHQGYLTWDSFIPYNPAWYEEGGGEITAFPNYFGYSVYDLVFQSLFYSDNTAWSHLVNHYYTYYGDFQSALIHLSGVVPPSEDLYQLNYATARMLNHTLIQLVTDPLYKPILDIMLQAQEGVFLKMYVHDHFAAKYGQYGANFHDMGAYFDGQGQPAYSIVVMSQGVYPIDFFLGELNAHLCEYYHYHNP